MRMTTHTFGYFALATWMLGAATSVDAAGYMLEPSLNTRVTSTVTVEFEAGGDLRVQGEKELEVLPMKVVAKLVYHERPVHWTANPKEPARSLRKYTEAVATNTTGDVTLEPTLAANERELAAEIRDGYMTINSPSGSLTREQQDLVTVMGGNSLAIDRLLPGREIAEGEGWDHDLATIAPLLGMDHVAVCEVKSVVTGESQDQVQIRLAGTVHGTIDGAPTEIDLRGAYLYHLKWKRITKFNLAIKEIRTPSEIVPGPDAVAQVKLTIVPATKADRISDDLVAKVSEMSKPLRRELIYDAKQLGFRFHHDPSWYPRGERSDVLAFRLLREGSLTAHCNISTLPPRSEGRETTLEQFERDVRASIGSNLEKVTNSTQWTTPLGNTCLGVIAEGKIESLSVQWRYYLVAAPLMPRVTLSVTVETEQLQRFADADRQLIDSLELVSPGSDTAAADSAELKLK